MSEQLKIDLALFGAALMAGSMVLGANLDLGGLIRILARLV